MTITGAPIHRAVTAIMVATMALEVAGLLHVVMVIQIECSPLGTEPQRLKPVIMMGAPTHKTATATIMAMMALGVVERPHVVTTTRTQASLLHVP